MGINAPTQPHIFLVSFVGCLSLQRFVFCSVLALSCRRSACPTNRVNRYDWRRFGRGLPTLTVLLRGTHAADGTALFEGHKVRALVRGEAASGASVPARSADNGPGIHMANIAVDEPRQYRSQFPPSLYGQNFRSVTSALSNGECRPVRLIRNSPGHPSRFCGRLCVAAKWLRTMSRYRFL